MNRSRIIPALALAGAGAGILAAPAMPRTIVLDVPATLAAQIARMPDAHGAPVLLPSRMPVSRAGLVGQGGPTPDGYAFTIATKGCGSANACTFAYFDAEAGRAPQGRRAVHLATGITGRYTPLSCGASCTPPRLEWRSRRYTYSISAAIGTQAVHRTQLIRLANQAITAGPR